MVTSSRMLRACSAMTSADRKSTRLNSSHLVISYAVFCLKKKKKNLQLCRKSSAPGHGCGGRGALSGEATGSIHGFVRTLCGKVIVVSTRSDTEWYRGVR